MKKATVRIAVLASLFGCFVACGGSQGKSVAPTGAAVPPSGTSVAAPPSGISAAHAPDRSDDDKKLDAGRHPAELLAFFQIGPGMKVAELGAGRGYTSELLARAVGPTGVVYGQNSQWILERFAEKPWSERLAKPVMKNVVRVDRDFEDPFPPEVQNLDAIFCVLFYHDLFWLNVDRDKMNRAAFRALKSGGVYAIIDHSAREGAGANEVKTMHRIEEKVVRAELEKAGFRFRKAASFLRNPSDTRDWNDSPGGAGDKRGTSDRFVLAYEKP